MAREYRLKYWYPDHIHTQGGFATVKAAEEFRDKLEDEPEKWLIWDQDDKIVKQS